MIPMHILNQLVFTLKYFFSSTGSVQQIFRRLTGFDLTGLMHIVVVFLGMTGL